MAAVAVPAAVIAAAGTALASVVALAGPAARALATGAGRGRGRAVAPSRAGPGAGGSSLIATRAGSAGAGRTAPRSGGARAITWAAVVARSRRRSLDRGLLGRRGRARQGSSRRGPERRSRHGERFGHPRRRRGRLRRGARHRRHNLLRAHVTHGRCSPRRHPGGRLRPPRVDGVADGRERHCRRSDRSIGRRRGGPGRRRGSPPLPRSPLRPRRRRLPRRAWRGRTPPVHPACRAAGGRAPRAAHRTALPARPRSPTAVSDGRAAPDARARGATRPPARVTPSAPASSA